MNCNTMKKAATLRNCVVRKIQSEVMDGNSKLCKNNADNITITNKKLYQITYACPVIAFITEH